MHGEQRLKILFLPAWYPSEEDPASGVFVKEHAKAVFLYDDIVVLYAYPDPSPRLKGLWRVSDGVEDGIRTLTIRYGGTLAYSKRRLLAGFTHRAKSQGDTGEGNSRSNFPLDMLKKPIKIPFLAIRDLLYYWSLFGAFRRLVKEGWKPDIIHAHVFTAGVPAVILGRIYHIPVIITEHTTDIPERKLAFFDRMKARYALKRANIILPVSNFLRGSIEAYGIKNQFRVIPNIVNNEIFYPDSSKIVSTRHTFKRKLLIVCLLSPQKGIPYLLEALKQIRQDRTDFALDMVGDGPNKKEYEELTRKLNLENAVRFHGLKTKIEVAAFMRNCDFFVQPSLMETFGIVYIEAMACGKPVIATNVGALKEIINEEVGILVTPKDVVALKKAIEYMLDNFQKYSPDRIRKYTIEKFSYEAVGCMLDSIYKDIKHGI